MLTRWNALELLPLILFEDEHLLVINKPAGMNTHAPSPYAGEGVYDWLRHREPRWATLATIQRLDKETSGVLVFAKTPLANRSLTEQFARRKVSKRYRLVTDRPVAKPVFTCQSHIGRAGEKYVSRRDARSGEADFAETQFRVLKSEGGRTLIEAEPRTGRTHQIRVHASESGFPILGDVLYGGTAAARVMLHAVELELTHPQTGERITFGAPDPFDADPRLALRLALVDVAQTDSFRLVHGAADRWPGWFVDRLGPFLLSQSERPLTGAQSLHLEYLLKEFGARGAYHKVLRRDVRQTNPTEASPQLVLGEAAPEKFIARENGLQFELSFAEGYSVGLFLDQRDNRRRLLTGHLAAGFKLYETRTGALASGAVRVPDGGEKRGRFEVLNAFAYTCGFSVAAAKAGARVTSLDLSKKYLDWGRRNFEFNGLDPAEHDFIYGEVFGWLKRLAKKGRQFDAIVLDPPTFSQSKEQGVFRAEKDYGKLVSTALPLLRPGGVLLASTNTAALKPEDFIAQLTNAIEGAGRAVSKQHYAPQPPDFPISRDQPAYLKTVWIST